MLVDTMENDQLENNIKNNILLIGGSSLFPGFKQRTQTEVVNDLKDKLDF